MSSEETINQWSLRHLIEATREITSDSRRANRVAGQDVKDYSRLAPGQEALRKRPKSRSQPSSARLSMSSLLKT